MRLVSISLCTQYLRMTCAPKGNRPAACALSTSVSAANDCAARCQLTVISIAFCLITILSDCRLPHTVPDIRLKYFQWRRRDCKAWQLAAVCVEIVEYFDKLSATASEWQAACQNCGPCARS